MACGFFSVLHLGVIDTEKETSEYTVWYCMLMCSLSSALAMKLCEEGLCQL